ncbi:hypothetical protein [Mesorhizobium japonicum]|uniref:hypothetical protein n=1 Tax=Mesorhizobium japonicum TaxID=2066070 RepID=UPI003B5C02FB
MAGLTTTADPNRERPPSLRPLIPVSNDHELANSPFFRSAFSGCLDQGELMEERYGFYNEAVELVRPVLEAERQRGNSGWLDRGDQHDTRGSWVMRFPLDIPALRAEFEFGNGVEVRAEGGGVIDLSGGLGSGAFLVLGGIGGTWRTRRRRAAWWRKWEISPRPRIRIDNSLPNYFN